MNPKNRLVRRNRLGKDVDAVLGASSISLSWLTSPMTVLAGLHLVVEPDLDRDPAGTVSSTREAEVHQADLLAAPDRSPALTKALCGARRRRRSSS